jgi:hypothetical protein
MVSSSDEHSPDDLTEEARAQLTSDAHAFYADNVADLRACDLTMERAGYDFYLTRNRHGAGFWDEGYRKPEGANAALTRLTNASHCYGSEDLYVVTPDGGIAIL